MDLIPRKFFLDDVFEDFLPENGKNNMKCDIYEKNDNYNIEMDLPGFNKEDISLDVEDDYLVVSAEKSESTNEDEKNYIKRERKYNKYQRSFHIGNINEDKISAKFNNGTLVVTFPKAQEKINTKAIKIED